MKVRELIKKLQTLDGNLDVVILTANKHRDEFNEYDTEDIQGIGLVPEEKGIFCGAVILSGDNTERYLEEALAEMVERTQELRRRQEWSWDR